MYLLLAIFAVAFPIVSLPCVVWQYCNQRKVLSAAIVVGIAMSVISMGIVNIGGGDLTAYSLEISKYNSLQFSEIWELKYANYPLASIVFWLISKTGNPHLLQAVIGFVEYMVLAYIVFDFSKIHNLQNKQIVCGVIAIIVFIPLFSSVSAVRSTPALAIGLLALYRDVVKGKRDIATIVLYVAPLAIHATGLSMLLVRLISLIANKSFMASAAIGFSVIPILLVFGQLFSGLFQFFGVNPIELLLSYVDQGSIGWSSVVSASTFYQLFRVLNIIFAVYVIFDICIRIMKMTYQDIEKGRLSVTVAGLALIVGFAVFVTDPSFMRYSYAIYPLVVLHVMMGLSRETNICSRDNGFHTEQERKSNYKYIAVAKWIYVLFGLTFLISHIYLMSLGAAVEPFIATLFFGPLGSPWLLG